MPFFEGEMNSKTIMAPASHPFNSTTLVQGCLTFLSLLLHVFLSLPQDQDASKSTVSESPPARPIQSIISPLAGNEKMLPFFLSHALKNPHAWFFLPPLTPVCWHLMFTNLKRETRLIRRSVYTVMKTIAQSRSFFFWHERTERCILATPLVNVYIAMGSEVRRSCR